MTEIPYFPATAPIVFADADQVRRWLASTLDALRDTTADAARSPERLGAPTPCAGYDLRALLEHVLGWLDLFGRAFADPGREQPRPDPETFRLAALGDDPAAGAASLVSDAAGRLDAALAAAVLDRRVVMAQAQMDGPAAIAMVLGEYLVHGWDIAVSTGQDWSPDPEACDAAYRFFEGMITPDYRGPEGFFGEQVPVPADASARDRLLGLAGRDPGWQAG